MWRLPTLFFRVLSLLLFKDFPALSVSDQQNQNILASFMVYFPMNRTYFSKCVGAWECTDKLSERCSVHFHMHRKTFRKLFGAWASVPKKNVSMAHTHTVTWPTMSFPNAKVLFSQVFWRGLHLLMFLYALNTVLFVFVARTIVNTCDPKHILPAAISTQLYVCVLEYGLSR